MEAGLFDAKVMNAFLEGTMNVLKTMCFTDAVAGKVGVKNATLKGDISGTISLTGMGQNGVFILSFSKQAAVLIVSRMVSEDKIHLDDEVRDAVGELTNMIAGNSRRNLEALGKKYEAGIPTVVVGAGHEIAMKVSAKSPVLMIPFMADGKHPFSVEFTFEKIK